MSTQGGLSIVTDGLVFSVDALNKLGGNTASTKNMVNPSESGSFENGASVVDGSFTFDGVDDDIDISDIVPTINSLGNGSVEIWCRLETSIIDQIIVSFYAPSTYYFTFGQYNNKLEYGLQGSSISNKWRIDSVGALFDGEWHQYVITYGGVEPTLYIDGELLVESVDYNYIVEIGNGRNTWWDESSFTIASLGSYASSSSFIDGQISTVKIYNKELTPSEVKQNYEATKHRFE